MANGCGTESGECYNRDVLSRIRRSVALKLILASAIPSALVLLVGLTALIAYTQDVARTDPALAFRLLREGALLGTALTLILTTG